MYECIKDKDTEVNGFLDLSIELTEAEIAMTSETTRKDIPASNFLLSNPVSIRPSQFPLNETKVNSTASKAEFQQIEQSFKAIQLSPTKDDDDVIIKEEEVSLIVVEDTDDLTGVCKLAANRTMHSPFKNRYATNPKLNETISAVKEIDPFDMHLQNAFLDDIDFIEYIRSLENVIITTRVRPIELNADLEMCDDTFNITKQIGHGSFGFVYRFVY